MAVVVELLPSDTYWMMGCNSPSLFCLSTNVISSSPSLLVDWELVTVAGTHSVSSITSSLSLSVDRGSATVATTHSVSSVVIDAWVWTGPCDNASAFLFTVPGW